MMHHEHSDRDDWIRHVLEQRSLTADCQRVGIFIALHMNRDSRQTNCQQKKIARELNMSPSTVKRAVASLIEAKLMEKDQLRRGLRNKAVNRYRIKGDS